jgi:hypothetical protein
VSEACCCETVDRTAVVTVKKIEHARIKLLEDPLC